MKYVLIVAVAAWSASAQPAPEECYAGKGDAVVESVTHDGKTYRFKRSGCRDLFNQEPERYAQLFDALAELEAEGSVIRKAEVSLVPS